MEEMSPFGPYRGPLVNSATTEVAGAEVGMAGPGDDPELATIMKLIYDAQLPRAVANEDDATYETSESEFEAWVRKMDQLGQEDDPPPSAPDSALPWWLKDDEEGEQDADKPDQLAA